MSDKKFVVGAADACGYDANGNLLFVGKTALESSLTTASSGMDVRGGMGNQVLYRVPDFKNEEKEEPKRAKTYAIFAKDGRRAINYLDSLIGEMKYKDVAFYKIFFSGNDVKAEAFLTNGDKYVVLSNYAPAIRGHKWDVAYASTSLSLDTLQELQFGFIGGDAHFILFNEYEFEEGIG